MLLTSVEFVEAAELLKANVIVQVMF
jgi:hypothetical protein